MLQVTKDPDSFLDYAVDWSAWLDTGDSLSTAQWLVSTTPGDAAPLVATSNSISGSIAVAWLTGGTVGSQYIATCRATTLEGRIQDYSFLVNCQQR